MILAVCIDDSNGLMFNNRRLSSDKAVIQDVLEFAAEKKISILPYSASIFQEFDGRFIINEKLNSNSEFCFAEFGDFLKIKDSVDMLIVYKWNRRYPSDTKFPLDAFKAFMTLNSTMDFEGSSHPCITREVYVR